MESAQLTVYCESAVVHEARYDPDSNASPVEAVAEAVATAQGTDPMDLPPLYDYIDVQAVNRLIGGRDTRIVGETVLAFTVETWNVLIRSDGHIRVLDPEQTAEPARPFEGANRLETEPERGHRPPTDD